MTERQRLAEEINKRVRERLFTQTLVERSCSRCRRPVEDVDLSPGRYWCRGCEANRKREQRAVRVAA